MTLLETTDLTKQFGDLLAVDRVDLAVETETTHSIIGPNGAGKSTLFNLITGLLTPTGGTVTFEGEDITGRPPHRIVRRGISRSFQLSDIFEGLTVVENVRIAVQATDQRRASMWRRADDLEDVARTARSIIDDVGLSEYADERADALGHGDRRKLEIGLAIATQPRLLLLDEPMAGMGTEDTAATIRMIERISSERGLTIVLIEHDLEVVMGVSDEITVLHEGAVIARGSPAAIREDEQVQDAYLGTETMREHA